MDARLCLVQVRFQTVVVTEPHAHEIYIFSIAVGIKMNVLLFAPGLLLLLLYAHGWRETMRLLTACAVVQFVIGKKEKERKFCYYYKKRCVDLFVYIRANRISISYCGTVFVYFEKF